VRLKASQHSSSLFSSTIGQTLDNALFSKFGVNGRCQSMNAPEGFAEAEHHHMYPVLFRCLQYNKKQSSRTVLFPVIAYVHFRSESSLGMSCVDLTIENERTACNDVKERLQRIKHELSEVIGCPARFELPRQAEWRFLVLAPIGVR
jgi:hypothetical protein